MEHLEDQGLSGNLSLRVKIITGSLVILENLFPENYRYRYSAPAEGQQQQLKTTSDVTSKFPWCCRASVL